MNRITVVSRETQAKLETYLLLLKKWNPKINLVSGATLAEAWKRHFVDSVQVFHLARTPVSNWLDLGSGGGFPGMVVAMMAHELDPGSRVKLVESDQRKAAFLRTVARETKTPVEIFAQRIETLEPQNADIVSARALANLETLLYFCNRHLKPTGTALFPKGQSWQAEVNEARKSWSFRLQAHKSTTNPSAVILEIGDIRRA